MKIAIISSSLNKKSNSLALAEYAVNHLKNKNVDVNFINMQDYTLPLCCAEEAYDHVNVKIIKSLIKDCNSLIISTPIYNKDVNAVLKNLLDLAGDIWSEKIVGLMCSAGGQFSYMALMPFANSLMLNFRCIIIPKFVYVTGSDFNDQHSEISNPEVIERIEELCETVKSYTTKLF